MLLDYRSSIINFNESWQKQTDYSSNLKVISVCFSQMTKAVAISDSHSQTEDVFDEEFDIVNLCTDIPNLFYNLMMAYIEMNDENASLIFQNLGPLVAKLKNEIKAIKLTLPAYTEAVAETDSMAVSLQNQMISAFQQLEMAIVELYAYLEVAAKTDDMQNYPPLGRMQIIQDQIEPAIVAFQKSCTAESEDILKNVIQSVDQS